jgi:hypothetical protein
MNFIVFAINAALSAMNFALYAGVGDEWNLGVAVFCGACALFNLALAVNE